jgi:general secretion pathway protein G
MCRSDPCPAPPQAHSSRRLTDLFRLNNMKVLLANVIIVVLLQVVSSIVLAHHPESPRLYRAMSDIRALELVINQFEADIGHYPKTENGLAVLVEPTTELLNSGNYKEGGYLDRLPRDPWGGEYQYQSPGVHNTASFDVWTFGSDGQAGGSGMADDAGNWPGAFERFQVKERRENMLYGIGIMALVGFIVGLPLYIAGAVIKIRNGLQFQSALLGFHLGTLIYLTLIGPFVVFLFMMIFTPVVRY